MNIRSSNVTELFDSKFSNCGTNTSLKGSAIYMTESSLNITQSTFEANQAVDGAAIYVK